MTKNFFAGRAVRRFNNNFERPSRRRPVRTITKRPKTQRTSQATETTCTYKLYRGTLNHEGLVVPLGPDPLYSGTQYFLASRNFNNYKVTRCSIEFTPLLNATTAQSMVNAYLTTDTKAVLPTNDIGMKQNTISHGGVEWFAGNRKVTNFKIPNLKQNTYETGSGEYNTAGSPFENCASVMVKPTSLADDKLSVGEIYLNVTVRFTGPAAPYLPATQNVIVSEGIQANEIIKSFQDHDMLKAIFYSKKSGNTATPAPVFACFCFNTSATSLEYYSCDVALADQDESWNKAPLITDKNICFYDTLPAKHFAWSTTSKSWVGTDRYLKSVEVLNNVVPAVDAEFITNLANELQRVKTLISLPVHNKITEDTDDTKVEVVNTPLPVDVTNDVLSVFVENEELGVEVLHQPILTQSEGNEVGDILGLISSVII